MILKKIVLLIFLPQVIYGSLPDPIVDTDVGQIRGLRADDGDYSMFLGIPFAKVNEENHFGPSTPYPKFEEPFEANDDSVVCPQIEEFNNTIVGSLDCLRLNVFVPSSATPTNRLPVLVYIYGGGFSFGFGNRFLYGPKFLVKNDIILVTINYRTGPFGFMCLDTPLVPGNQGLKDQVLALRWVKKHIGAFNGDPDKVSVAGNSAGSASVDFHLVSNTEKLFDKAIFQSANIIGLNGAISDRGPTIILARHFGSSTNDVDEAVKFLSTVSTTEIIAATAELQLAFQPCIELEFEGVESFITEPWVTANLPKVKDLPILIGVNDDEALSTFVHLNDNDFWHLPIISSLLQGAFNMSHPDFEGMEDIMHHFYFGDDVITVTNRQEVMDFTSDFMFSHPAIRSVNKYLEYEAGNIFFYKFSYVGQRNFARWLHNIPRGVGGATHADEIGFLFDVSFMQSFVLSAEEQLVVDRMAALWTNFIKYGNPTPSTSQLLPVIWTPITSESPRRPYLEIGAELSVGGRPFTQRLTFWELYYKANEHLLLPPLVPQPASSSFKIDAHLFIIGLSIMMSLLFNQIFRLK